MILHTAIRPHGAFRVSVYHVTPDGRYQPGSPMVEKFMLERQPINPKTGKPWQAWRTVQTFDAKGPAMRAWLYAVTKPAR